MANYYSLDHVFRLILLSEYDIEDVITLVLVEGDEQIQEEFEDLCPNTVEDLNNLSQEGVVRLDKMLRRVDMDFSGAKECRRVQIKSDPIAEAFENFEDFLHPQLVAE